MNKTDSCIHRQHGAQLNSARLYLGLLRGFYAGQPRSDVKANSTPELFLHFAQKGKAGKGESNFLMKLALFEISLFWGEG